jgi:hypothetical protein
MIEEQRHAMITALYANPNWDGENAQKRVDQIAELNKHFNRAIELVYYPEAQEPDVDWKNPFYAAAKRGLERTRQKLGLTGKSMAEVIELTTAQDQEQIKARIEARKSIDQA